MIRIILVGIFLVFNTICDIKVKKLPLAVILLFCMVGVLINFVLPEYSSKEIIFGVAVGAVLLLVSFITSGQIGAGDGLLFMVTGLFIGGINNIRLLLWASIVCAPVAGVLLMTKQVGRRDKIPFVPFVLFAYMGQVIL